MPFLFFCAICTILWVIPVPYILYSIVLSYPTWILTAVMSAPHNHSQSHDETETYAWSQSFNLRHTLYIALTHYSLSHNHYKVLLQVLPVMLLSLLHFYVIYCFDLYLFNDCSFCLSKPFGLFAVDCFNKTVMCNCVCLYIHEKTVILSSNY